jgi:hypothetical protein
MNTRLLLIGLNSPVAVIAALMVTAQLRRGVPSQALPVPAQLVKNTPLPLVVVAVRVSAVPGATSSVQSPGQLMPGPVMVPDVPLRTTSSRTRPVPVMLAVVDPPVMVAVTLLLNGPGMAGRIWTWATHDRAGADRSGTRAGAGDHARAPDRQHRRGAGDVAGVGDGPRQHRAEAVDLDPAERQGVGGWRSGWRPAARWPTAPPSAPRPASPTPRATRCGCRGRWRRTGRGRCRTCRRRAGCPARNRRRRRSGARTRQRWRR